MSVWTEFWDMNSGGGRKEEWSRIYIEAPEKEARVIFYNRFGHSPDRVTCTCCGEDYSTSSGSLTDVTGYHRNLPAIEPEGGSDSQLPDGVSDYLEPGEAVPEGCSIYNEPFRRGGVPISIEDYMRDPEVLFIRSEDILPEWRQGEVPEQGYVWVD